MEARPRGGGPRRAGANECAGDPWDAGAGRAANERWARAVGTLATDAARATINVVAVRRFIVLSHVLGECSMKAPPLNLVPKGSRVKPWRG